MAPPAGTLAIEAYGPNDSATTVGASPREGIYWGGDLLKDAAYASCPGEQITISPDGGEAAVVSVDNTGGHSGKHGQLISQFGVGELGSL
jgi:hypothetical protein